MPMFFGKQTSPEDIVAFESERKEERERKMCTATTVSWRQKRRIAVKFRAFARMNHILRRSQDIHCSTNLCKRLLHISITVLRSSLPIAGLRSAAVELQKVVEDRAAEEGKGDAKQRRAVLLQRLATLRGLKREDGVASAAAQLAHREGAMPRVPIERMLGTALVLAFLDLRRLMPAAEQRSRSIASAEQIHRAVTVPWELSERPFIFYVSVFKVMLSQGASPGRFERAFL
ncbi:hypothetical protein CYMTET_46280 [Cymbomonas tetramitiformis]|uniref:Uncharacterized protein n=1 Tax=Cymbomonas tetramitiformis TaxID=36881 RepID=A0AAE0BWG5_9CHLO|nr:hypothetical protein CYMTET_46280 [Cymbomonas tetramitiformis]